MATRQSGRVRRRIQAVTFDIGGTLIEPWPSVGHVYADVAGRFGIRANPDQLTLRFGAAWKAKRGFDYSRAAWFELVRSTFEPDAWRIAHDALQAIDALATQGIRLGAISNWDDRLLPLLERLELRRHFETVAVSCEVGFAKPSPEIFHHALRKLGLPPEATLHVGDSMTEDVEGARSAGMSAALIRRREREPASPPIIRDLRELTVIIGQARE